MLLGGYGEEKGGGAGGGGERGDGSGGVGGRRMEALGGRGVNRIEKRDGWVVFVDKILRFPDSDTKFALLY